MWLLAMNRGFDPPFPSPGRNVRRAQRSTDDHAIDDLGREFYVFYAFNVRTRTRPHSSGIMRRHLLKATVIQQVTTRSRRGGRGARAASTQPSTATYRPQSLSASGYSLPSPFFVNGGVTQTREHYSATRTQHVKGSIRMSPRSVLPAPASTRPRGTFPRAAGDKTQVACPRHSGAHGSGPG